MSKVTLDYNFAAKPNINCGIPTDALLTYKSKAADGFNKLDKMVEDGSVGFPGLAYQSLTELKEVTKDLYGKFNDLIIVGIGGSSLGFEALTNALLPYGYNSNSFVDRKGCPRYWLLDNADPFISGSALKYCKPEDSFTIIISKSGNTVETAANFSIVFDWYKAASMDISKHIAVVTDPAKGPLYEFGKGNNLRMLGLEANVGGRFSVLSPVGLLPASLLGMDIDSILKGAASVVESGKERVLTLAAIYMYFMETKSINVLMPYSSRLVKFAEWFCQLWGESLGKKKMQDGKTIYFGTTPMRCSGSIDQHSQLQLFREGPDDKFFTFIGLENHENDVTMTGNFSSYFSYLSGHRIGDLLNAELKATEAALLMLNRPSLQINIEGHLDEFALGELFMLYQYVVAIIGLAGGVNPFDQPGVEEGKDFAYGIMGREGYKNKKEQFDSLYVKNPKFTI